jgi:hypothetical protein
VGVNVPPVFDLNVTVAPITGAPLAVTKAVIAVVYPLLMLAGLAVTVICRGE